jgi:protein-S-isoprenylcysteine O-methyltransferase Ste14
MEQMYISFGIFSKNTYMYLGPWITTFQIKKSNHETRLGYSHPLGQLVLAVSLCLVHMLFVCPILCQGNCNPLLILCLLCCGFQFFPGTYLVRQIIIIDFETKVHHQKTTPRKCYIYSKANWNTINKDLNTLTCLYSRCFFFNIFLSFLLTHGMLFRDLISLFGMLLFMVPNTCRCCWIIIKPV